MNPSALGKFRGFQQEKSGIMDRTKHYTYRVTWSEEDEEYVGLVAEFPSLSWLAPEQGGALEGIVRLVRDVIADMEANGEPPPEPLTQRKYSGELRVRMPPALHQRLAIRAAEEHTSLNALILRQLV